MEIKESFILDICLIQKYIISNFLKKKNKSKSIYLFDFSIDYKS